MRLSDSTLHGQAVISADGKMIGTLTELFISTSDWRVESIRIELRKDIADQIGANRTIFHRGTIDVEQLREAHRPPATDAAPPP